MAIYTTEAFEGSSWRRLVSEICPTTSIGFHGYEFNEKKDSQYIYLRSVKEVHCIRNCTWRDLRSRNGRKRWSNDVAGVCRRETIARVGKRRR